MDRRLYRLIGMGPRLTKLIAASSLHWLSRPHIFTFLMLALWMNVMQELRDGQLHRL